MASKAEAEGPAGSSAILAALASSALAAGITLFASELLRIASAELRERVFTPRVTHRREGKRGEEVRRCCLGVRLGFAARCFHARRHAWSIVARPHAARRRWI